MTGGFRSLATGYGDMQNWNVPPKNVFVFVKAEEIQEGTAVILPKTQANMRVFLFLLTLTILLGRFVLKPSTPPVADTTPGLTAKATRLTSIYITASCIDS